MRLLVRSNAHRCVDAGVVEVAASPDTPRRELWQWQVRVLDAPAVRTPADPGVRRVEALLPRGSGTSSTVEVSGDAATVTPSVDVLEVDGPMSLERDLQEVLVLAVGRGRARVEDRHLLGELDVLVLEGDDPFSVTVEPAADTPTSVAVARLQATGARLIGWVP